MHLNNGDLRLNHFTLVPASENQRPTAPTALRSAISGDKLCIEWNPAKDAETPTEGLEYNISMRKKGMTGEGAYLLSPMNMERDNVSVPSCFRLLTAPRVNIPLTSIPAGDYEVRVQAVDAQRLTGAFSEPLTITIKDYIRLEAPTEAMVGAPVDIKIVANQMLADISFGSGADAQTTENGYSVTWKESGLKEIKVDGSTLATVNVHEALDASFDLPENVLANAEIVLNCPTASMGKWEFVDRKGIVCPMITSEMVKNFAAPDGKVSFTLATTEPFTIRHTLTESFGNATAENTATVITDNAIPVISYVDVANGKSVIHIDESSVPEGSIAINIYRETSRLNEFEQLATLPVGETAYTDASSRADVKADRYCIAAALAYGESAKSEAHQPMHLQLNRGLGEAINLRWSKYEGRDVTSYNIFGGDSPESLALVESVSGHSTSYTASHPAAYYSVGTVFAPRTRAGNDGVKSNVAATADASAAALITSIKLTPYGGSNEFGFNDGPIRIIASILPSGATYQSLDWEIVKGYDLASISSDGYVTATSAGDVTVKVSARDGSGVTASIDLKSVKAEHPLTWLEFIKWPENHEIQVGESFEYEIIASPQNATETPFWEIQDPTIASVDQNGIVTGLKVGSTMIIVRSLLNPELMIGLTLDVIPSSHTVYVERIEIVPGELKVSPGDVVYVSANVYPEDAWNKELTWKVLASGNACAWFSAPGELTVTRTGTATITATSTDGTNVVGKWLIVSEEKKISDIEAIFADGARFDIYSIDGMLILRDADRESVTCLSPGYYIVNGRRLIIK